MGLTAAWRWASVIVMKECNGRDCIRREMADGKYFASLCSLPWPVYTISRNIAAEVAVRAVTGAVTIRS